MNDNMRNQWKKGGRPKPIDMEMMEQMVKSKKRKKGKRKPMMKPQEMMVQ